MMRTHFGMHRQTPVGTCLKKLLRNGLWRRRYLLVIYNWDISAHGVDLSVPRAEQSKRWGYSGAQKHHQQIKSEGETSILERKWASIQVSTADKQRERCPWAGEIRVTSLIYQCQIPGLCPGKRQGTQIRCSPRSALLAVSTE